MLSSLLAWIGRRAIQTVVVDFVARFKWASVRKIAGPGRQAGRTGAGREAG